MNKSDFNYIYNAEGYMIQYKNKNIGGAGIIGKYKGKGRQRTQQLESYRQQAETTIEQLCSNRGNKYMLDNIKKIDELSNY